MANSKFDIAFIPYALPVFTLCISICLEFILPAHPLTIVVLIAGSIVTILLVIIFRKQDLLYVLFLLLIFGYGFWRQKSSHFTPVNHNKTLLIKGHIFKEKGYHICESTYDDKIVRILLLAPGSKHIKLPFSGIVQVEIPFQLPESNPGSPSWKYIQYQLKCAMCGYLVRIVKGQNTTPFPDKRLTSLRNFLGNNFKRPLSGMLLALMTGDRSQLPRVLSQQFQLTGLSHVLALSGFHVGLYFLILMALPLPFTYLKKWKPLLITVILLCYLQYTHYPSSLVRATIMGLTWMWCYSLQIHIHHFHPVFLSAFLILLYEPRELFSLGFILSFGAVTGIFLFLPLLASALNRIPILRSKWSKYVILFFTVPLSAQLFTMPLILKTFNYLTVGSIISNLLIYPFIFPIIFLSWISYFLFLIHVPVDFFIHTIHFLYFQFSTLNRNLSGISTALSFSGISPLLFSIYYCLLGIIIWAITVPSKKTLWIPLLIAFIFLFFVPNRRGIYLLQVGQAESVLIHDKATILLDVGKDQRTSSRHTDVLKALLALRVDSVHAVFISHPDFDHYGQLFRILKQYPNTPLYFSMNALSEPRKLHHILRKIPHLKQIHFIAAGSEFRFTPDLKINCLYPGDTDMERGNRGSAVLFIQDQDLTVMQPGDLPGMILERVKLPDSVDVLIAPHHGADSGIKSQLLREMKCNAVWISCGYSNSYGHPAPTVLKLLRKNNIEVKRTDVNGCIFKRSD